MYIAVQCTMVQNKGSNQWLEPPVLGVHDAGSLDLKNIHFQNVSLPWCLSVHLTQFDIHLIFLYW